MNKFKIRISRDGQKIQIEGEGFSGPECLERAQSFIRSLGGDIESQTLKLEYSETPYTDPLVELEQG
jgi:hypothetical protein